MGRSDQVMPVVFVGHGSPMNAIEDSRWRQRWQQLGRELPRPRAILCISAHWEAPGVRVSTAASPPTIHDFYGFPPALFAVQYPAPGSPELAERVMQLLAGHTVVADAQRGLDHGAWSVLLPMYPDADVPVVQLSMDTRQPGAYHYALAQQLAPLRDEGVLVLASGNIVHNLRTFNFHDLRPATWAQQFDHAIAQRLTAGDDAGLAAWSQLGPHAAEAIPTPEHYLPLLYALALRRPQDRVQFFNEDVISTLSMRSVIWANTDVHA